MTDEERARASNLCRRAGAHVLRQLIESESLKIVGGYGHGWEMSVTQAMLVKELLSLADRAALEQSRAPARDAEDILGF